MSTPEPLTVKGICCEDRPRCRRCPVVWDRLVDAGLAKRLAPRRYRLRKKAAPKRVAKAIAAARRR